MIHCLSEIQVQLGIQGFDLLNPATVCQGQGHSRASTHPERQHLQQFCIIQTTFIGFFSFFSFSHFPALRFFVEARREKTTAPVLAGWVASHVQMFPSYRPGYPWGSS